MPMLARSLLALAALLAAANAAINCKTVLFGVATTDFIGHEPVVYYSDGGKLIIENACQTQQQRVLAGELITACNFNQHGVAPNITERNPPRFSPIGITCPVDGCLGGGVAQIMQFCY